MSDKIEKYNENQPEQVVERPSVAPRVDIYENRDEVLLLADLPGVSKDQLTLHLEKDHLSIEGRVQERELGKPVGRHAKLVDFRRSFVVPPGIDASKIVAELNQGVLKLHLPKSESLKPRQIQVKAG